MCEKRMNEKKLEIMKLKIREKEGCEKENGVEMRSRGVVSGEYHCKGDK